MLECVNQNVLIFIFLTEYVRVTSTALPSVVCRFLNIVLFFACWPFCYIKKLAYLHLDPDLSLTVISLTGP